MSEFLLKSLGTASFVKFQAGVTLINSLLMDAISLLAAIFVGGFLEALFVGVSSTLLAVLFSAIGTAMAVFFMNKAIEFAGPVKVDFSPSPSISPKTSLKLFQLNRIDPKSFSKFFAVQFLMIFIVLGILIGVPLILFYMGGFSQILFDNIGLILVGLVAGIPILSGILSGIIFVFTWISTAFYNLILDRIAKPVLGFSDDNTVAYIDGHSIAKLNAFMGVLLMLLYGTVLFAMSIYARIGGVEVLLVMAAVLLIVAPLVSYIFTRIVVFVSNIVLEKIGGLKLVFEEVKTATSNLS